MQENHGDLLQHKYHRLVQVHQFLGRFEDRDHQTQDEDRLQRQLFYQRF